MARTLGGLRDQIELVIRECGEDAAWETMFPVGEGNTELLVKGQGDKDIEYLVYLGHDIIMPEAE